MNAQTLIVALIGSGALASLISGIFTLAAQKRKRKSGEAAGTRILLYDRIKYLCKSHIAHGSITVEDLEDINRMWRVYHDDLDGNGFLDGLMKQVSNLTIER